MNPRIVEITERIRARSRDSRAAYLEGISAKCGPDARRAPESRHCHFL